MVTTPPPAVERDAVSFWEEAYAAHGPAVLAFLARRLSSRAEAEDLLQETFVRAMRTGNARHERLLYYLLTTARHLLVNRLRRPRLVVSAEALVPPAPGESDLPSPLEAFADPAPSPERNAAWSAFRSGLRSAVARLSPDLRRAFELAVVERCSYAEVMRLTGWTLPQVKSNVFRARQRVLAALGERLDDAVWSHG